MCTKLITAIIFTIISIILGTIIVTQLTDILYIWIFSVIGLLSTGAAAYNGIEWIETLRN